MPTFVITTIGSAGDVFPMLAIGAGLKTRGHQVVFINNPYFQSLAETAGITFIPIGRVEEFTNVIDNPDTWHPRKSLIVVVKKAILPFIRQVYDILTGFDPRETILVSSGMAAPARIAQEKHGFRLATVHLQPSILMSAHDPAELGGFRLPEWLPTRLHRWWLTLSETLFVDPLLVPEITRFRGELGIHTPMGHFFSQWMHSPDMVIGLWPGWFAPPQPDWPPNTHLTGFIHFQTGERELPPNVTRFLDSGEPPLVFTPGSAMKFGANFFRAARQACQSLGKRAVFLTRFQEHLPPDLPPTILHAAWLPMDALLQRAALIVHHGGIGTTAQALAAGIPQLVSPHSHDQPDNANRLRKLGVGGRLDPKHFTPSRLRDKLDHLLNDPQTRQNCRQYAQKVDFDRALSETCTLIERLLPEARKQGRMGRQVGRVGR